MKNLLFLWSIAGTLVVAGCVGSEDPVLVEEVTEDVEAVEVEAVTEADRTVDAEVLPASFSRDTTVVAASSTLEDDTGVGFAYHAAQALDLDYSTAWCAGPDDELPTFTLDFFSPVTFTAENNMVGIVPGFARDETIFYRNNRIKTILVWYDDMTEPIDIFSFEDSYGMQFFDLPIGDVSTMKLQITEVYPGSKYDDTCLAEVDFWSDWVMTQDADAAHDYYLENAENNALRPVGLDSVFLSYTDSSMTSSCKDYAMTTFDTDDWGDTIAYFYPSSEGYTSTFPTEEGGDKTDTGFYFTYDVVENQYYFPCCEPIWVALNLNEFAREGDEITVKWFHTFSNFEEPVVRETVLKDTFQWSVGACSEDFFILEVLPEYEGFPMGIFTLEFYYKDRLIGTTHYLLGQ